MPVYSRKTLRQSLGRSHWLGDTLVGRTTASFGSAGSAQLIDSKQANLAFSGHRLYEHVWGKVIGQDAIRIATWNAGSGAWFSFQGTGTNGGIPSGSEYEIHKKVDPADKDRALDHAISRVRIKQEYPLWAIKDARHYVLSANVLRVLDAYYFHDPAHSLNREQHRLAHWEVVNTASGQELRIAPALDASEQIILEAILEVSLGAADVATVNIPSDDWIIAGAAAVCLKGLAAGAPGKEKGDYLAQQRQAAAEYTRLSSRYQEQIAQKLELADLYAPELE